MRKARLALSMAVGLLVAFTATAAAQDYPTKPVRLIVPFPPGGSNDVVGRIVATGLGARLGKQVVIDNRGGAGGVIGTEVAANAAPDGYTLLVISLAHTVNPGLYKLKYDPIKSFVPVAMLGSGVNVLCVHPSVPVNTLKELLALAKQKPGKLDLRHRRFGQLPAHGVRAVQADGRHRYRARAVQRGRPRDDRRGRRSQPHRAQLAHSDHAPHPLGQAEAAGNRREEALAHPARRSDHRRSRRARLRDDQLVGYRRTRRHAAGRSWTGLRRRSASCSPRRKPRRCSPPRVRR